MPPLVVIALAWLAGLLAAHFWLMPLGVSPLALVVLALVSLAAMLCWPRDRSLRLGATCALALLLASLRYGAALPDLDDPGLVAHYNDQGWVTLEGTVHAYPEVRDTWTQLTVSAEQIEVGARTIPVRGQVLVRAPRYPELHYGDRLRLSGLLETPPVLDAFSYRDYLARQGIYSLVNWPQIERLASGQRSPFWTAVFSLKDRSRDLLAQLIPEPAASLLQGILLGIESGIPSELYDQFNATGTSHIIVISGTNITVIAALFSQVFRRMLGKRRAYAFTVGGILLYVLLVGADPVVVRAGVMGSLYVTARHLGRRATAYVSLFASAVLLTLINPFALWDVGFQLSFAATLSLILFTPPLERLLERALRRVLSPHRSRAAVRYLNDVLVVTLAAQILTLPLIVYHFGRVSLVAPLANLLILPVQPPIMIAGGAATLIGLVPWLVPLARVVAWLAWLCLAYTVAVVHGMAGWPWASLSVGPAAATWLGLGYGLALFVAWALSRQGRRWIAAHRSRRATTLSLGLPLAGAVLTWLAVLQLPDGRLHIAFLDVGQGDAVLITTPRGQQVLVDGGPSPAALTTALGREMPFWDRSLDAVVMTHADADHITGLVEVLDRYRVDLWLDNSQPANEALYAACQRRLRERDVLRASVARGYSLDMGEGIVLEVLHPPPEPMTGTEADDNNNSLVLRLVWEGARFLLAGDLEAEGEHLLLTSHASLAATVLKVAHHGSSGSSTEAFLEAVAPRYAIISVGADNRFGHPHGPVLDRLAALGEVVVLRTDRVGTVEFETDGQRLWVRTER